MTPVPSPRHQPGAGPTVILLHGSGGNHHVFDGVVDELRGVDVYAFSYPGRLGEPGPPCRDIDALIDWLDDKLETMGLIDVVAVGHSLGTALAVGLADRQSRKRLNRVRALLLLATPTRPPAVRVIADLWRAALLKGDVAKMRTMGFLPNTPPDIVTRVVAAEELTPLEVASADWDVAVSIGERTPPPIPQHVEFVVGSLDRMGPEAEARKWAQSLPSAAVEVWEGVGHRLEVEEPRRVAQAIQALRER